MKTTVQRLNNNQARLRHLQQLFVGLIRACHHQRNQSAVLSASTFAPVPLTPLSDLTGRGTRVASAAFAGDGDGDDDFDAYDNGDGDSDGGDGNDGGDGGGFGSGDDDDCGYALLSTHEVNTHEDAAGQ